MDYQYFGQAIVEVLSIDLQIANSPRVVAIGSIDFAIDYFVGLAKNIGNSKAIEAIVDYFSKHYSNQVDYIVEDLGYYGFAIDYHIDLNFAKGPK